VIEMMHDKCTCKAMWVQHNINAETEYYEIVIINTECNYINKTTDSNEKSPCGPGLTGQRSGACVPLSGDWACATCLLCS
jgi:hypothetical protein